MISPFRFNFSVATLSVAQVQRPPHASAVISEWALWAGGRADVAVKKGAFWKNSDLIQSKYINEDVGRAFRLMHCFLSRDLGIIHFYPD